MSVLAGPAVYLFLFAGRCRRSGTRAGRHQGCRPPTVRHDAGDGRQGSGREENRRSRRPAGAAKRARRALASPGAAWMPPPGRQDAGPAARMPLPAAGMDASFAGKETQPAGMDGGRPQRPQAAIRRGPSKSRQAQFSVFFRCFRGVVLSFPASFRAQNVVLAFFGVFGLLDCPVFRCC